MTLHGVQATVVAHPKYNGSGLSLHGDSSLPLDLQLVQNLLVVIVFADGAHVLEDAVGQGRLAVVDVSHDTEVPDPIRPELGQVRGGKCDAAVIGSRRAGP